MTSPSTAMPSAPALDAPAVPDDPRGAVLPDADADVRVVLPEGTDRPADVPEEIFSAVLRIFSDQRRLDMQELARELGVARATLYRRSGSREALLSAVIWWRSRLAIAAAVAGSVHLRGVERVTTVSRWVLTAFDSNPALQHFLETEPVAALRVLTGPNAGVQSGFVATTQRLLDLEQSRGHLELALDSQTLAYVICRIGEGFLYADHIADRTPDVDAAADITGRLLLGACWTPGEAGRRPLPA